MQESTKKNIEYYSDEVRLEYYDAEESKFFYTDYYRKNAQNILDKILENFRNTEKMKILDIACGTGYIGRELLNSVDNKILIGADVTFMTLTKASNSKAYDYLVNSDASLMAFKSNTFDIVIIHSALHHIANYKELIFETSRALKQGGYFWIACESLVRVTKIYIFLLNILNLIRPKKHINENWKEVEYHIFKTGGFYGKDLKQIFSGASLDLFIESYNNLEFIHSLENVIGINLYRMLPNFIKFPKHEMFSNKFDYVGIKNSEYLLQ